MVLTLKMPPTTSMLMLESSEGKETADTEKELVAEASSSVTLRTNYVFTATY
jgi:hypothetical protein